MLLLWKKTLRIGQAQQRYKINMDSEDTDGTANYAVILTVEVTGVDFNGSFPKDPIIKNRWIEATGRKNWFPTKHSRICSVHFHKDTFTGQSKCRRIISTAYPTIDVVIMSNNEKVCMARAGALTYSMNSDNDPEGDIIAILPSKEYLPKEDELAKDVITNHGADMATYILSKLSDKELVSLLNDQPKKDKFALKDIVKASSGYKSRNAQKSRDTDNYIKKEINYKEPTSKGQNQNPKTAVFRLDEKEVQPYNFKPGVDPNYIALQKIQNLLYSRPAQQDLDGDYKKELLFDMLTAQLKKLCCKSSKSKKLDVPKQSYQTYLNGALNKKYSLDQIAPKMTLHEHMFLIINDEITNDEKDDLITVDPESLSVNSSVLLLGPITTPLKESQLKLVMNRITTELSKDEYLPLFQQILEGRLSEFNTHLVKSLISGPSTRRYIKPHRCNHQSKLAKVHAGPKWLVCTGYLNINTPSLYD